MSRYDPIPQKMCGYCGSDCIVGAYPETGRVSAWIRLFDDEGDQLEWRQFWYCCKGAAKHYWQGHRLDCRIQEADPRPSQVSYEDDASDS